MDSLATPTPSFERNRFAGESCDKDVSAPDIRCFPRFTASSHRGGLISEVSGKPESSQVKAAIVDSPTPRNTTCAAARRAVEHSSSDETVGTFTVFAKLAVCVVSWS
jgi:hypothetical protein